MVIGLEQPGAPRRYAAAGHVDRERTLPMDAQRAFQIGSITKTFTAAAILLLVNDGQLSLDQKLSDFISDFNGSGDVTVRHLLTHSSGIGDGQVYVDIPQPYTREHFTLEDFLVMGRIQGQQFEPGQGFAYNNAAFYILGAIVESVTGQTLSSFLRSRVFEPLEMESTWVGAQESWPHDRMARGYYRNPGATTVIETTGPNDLSIAGPAGDMISTADDLLTWLDAIVAPNDPLGLDLEDFTADAATWKRNTTEPYRGIWLAYGRGFMQGSLAGEIVWGHAGGIHGYTALAFIHPPSGTRIVLGATQDADPSNDPGEFYQAKLLAMAALFHAAVH